ncbi:glycosyltransferase family 2 protein [Flavobacterium sp. J27]|uniref:glycosyltransferase family 2 protein n=1 Tax=Flavobacterium sp. J27 TaxID=2060419 RepID=UPI0010320ADB|nr:glycosyltransferase family 2 protein [Flavobacterium sp. J27]
MDASIIITTFRRSHFLTRAIDSVLLQNTNYKYEIIIIDDNGLETQNQLLTRKTIDKYILYNQIQYYPLEINKGACYARNYGVSKAKGNYIFFLDDDDSYENSKIQTQMAFMLNHSNLDGCLAPFKRLNAKEEEIKANSNFPVVEDFVNFSIRGNFFTPMLCIKKNKLIEIGGFQEIDRFQDRFLMLHALKSNLNFACLEQPLHIMYEHESDRISSLNISKTIVSLDKIYDFIVLSKNSFSKKEWNMFKINDLTIRAIQYYLSKDVKNRLYAIRCYFKICILDLNMKNCLNFIKSIFNIVRRR